MTKFHSGILLSAFLLVPCSCGRHVEERSDSLRYVDELLADSLSWLEELSEASGKASGAIALIGTPEECLQVSERLMTADDFDNVDGRPAPDGLPDFAGETVVSILDFTDSSAREYADSSLLLRELAVRIALRALEPSCRVSPYDADSVVSKPSPKMLLVCSPRMGVRCAADIEDLFARTGCNVPVLAAQDTAYSFTRDCFRLLRQRNAFTHDVSYPKAELYMMIVTGFSGSVLIGFNGRYAPGPFLNTARVLAPKTMESCTELASAPRR